MTGKTGNQSLPEGRSRPCRRFS